MEQSISGRITEILGLFPSFNSEKFGGIQYSGRLAWKSITDTLGAAQTEILFYNTGYSKTAALFSAIRLRRAKRVLIWHLQLAKLSFVGWPEARVVVFLHGIEAWRKLDGLTRAAL